MLFYTFDQEIYTKDRDFYCDFDQFAPGYVETDFRKMTYRAAKILAGENDPETEEEISRKKAGFSRDFLSAIDGRSTERIVTYLREQMLPELVKRR